MKSMITRKISGLFNRSTKAIFLAIGIAGVLASSCDTSNQVGQVEVLDETAGMSFTAPQPILTARNIVSSNLVLRITIGDIVNDVRADENGEYRLVIRLPENTQTEVSLLWFEVIDGVELTLAEASDIPLFVGSASSPAFRSFEFDEFNTSFDADNDGFSNLRERTDGSEVDNPLDPGRPPVNVVLAVVIELPEIFDTAADEVLQQLTAEASVNDTDILLQRDGNSWLGEALAPENSDALVTVNFYNTPDRLVRLVNQSDSLDVGSGATFVFSPEDYENLDALNNDADEFNNAEEVAQGTDPTNPLDPDFDGDGLSFAADNCPTVANPEQENIDEDSLGDACDEINDNDTDGDGVDNELDNCPAVANPNQDNEDGDSLGDACDEIMTWTTVPRSRTLIKRMRMGIASAMPAMISTTLTAMGSRMS